MTKCIRCGADTSLIVMEEPLCVDCATELENRRDRRRAEAKPPTPSDENGSTQRRILADRYSAAVQQYQSDVRELARAAGGFELEIYGQHVNLHMR